MLYFQLPIVVGVAIGLGVGRTGFRVPVGTKCLFSSPKPSTLALGSKQPSVQRVSGLFPGCKAVGVEVKNEWSFAVSS
jgi:hypothetical protein